MWYNFFSPLNNGDDRYLHDFQAMLVFKKALKLDPRNSVAALGLSDVLCRENMLEAACTRYVVNEYTLVPIWFPK